MFACRSPRTNRNGGRKPKPTSEAKGRSKQLISKDAAFNPSNSRLPQPLGAVHSGTPPRTGTPGQLQFQVSRGRGQARRRQGLAPRHDHKYVIAYHSISYISTPADSMQHGVTSNCFLGLTRRWLALPVVMTPMALWQRPALVFTWCSRKGNHPADGAARPTK